MAGFKDMVKAAQTQAKREGDYINPNQRGTILVREYKCHKGQSGKFCVLLGEITEVKPKVTGGSTQPVGTVVKVFDALYGDPKKQAAGFSNVKAHLMALTGVGDEDIAQVLDAVFGDNEDGISDLASAEAKAAPTFAARGVLVDFDSYEVEKEGKKYTRVKLHHRSAGNGDDEILARQKTLAK